MTIIDIREPDEVGRTGAIPGAIQAPRGMLKFWPTRPAPITARSSTPRRAPCSTAHSGGRSALAVQSLQTLGYADVAHLDGGLKASAEHGGPVTHHAPN